uniref:DUF2634 domain-containing protein n=1 Tax=Strongyloides venezuelensis TaxID=75913 RepID=A0A0K0FFP0_STRVS
MIYIAVYVNSDKKAIENNDIQVNNAAVLIKIPDNVINGFECTDNYYILTRTKIKGILDDFLQQVAKYRRAFIYVNSIKIDVRFNFINNQFHKEIEILEYSVSENELFTVNVDLEVLKTVVCEVPDGFYYSTDDEKRS